MISIPSHQLDAFFKVAQTLSFSRAAQELGIGQPALSQRILALESDLQLTLIERGTSVLKLTSSGELLFQYCQKKQSLEAEVLQALTSKGEEVAGILRIAGSSTIVGPVVVPTLSPLLKKHPQVQPEMMVRQLAELPELLLQGQVDFVLLDKPIQKMGIESVEVGFEAYAVFEATKGNVREDVYYDTFADDHLTENFFKFHKSKGEKVPKSYRRDFTGDVQVMLEMVEKGLGRAVLPVHLLRQKRAIHRIDKFKNVYSEPVYLCFWQNEFPSKLMNEVRTMITSASRRFLDSRL